MVLVKNRIKYFYYILSIKAAYCNLFCKRFIRGFYNYYTKIFTRKTSVFLYFLSQFHFSLCARDPRADGPKNAGRNPGERPSGSIPRDMKPFIKPPAQCAHQPKHAQGNRRERYAQFRRRPSYMRRVFRDKPRKKG